MPASSFARGSFMIAAGTGGAQLISIAAAPILTRLYLPADYGAYSVALAVLTIVVTIGCLGFENAIPLPAEDRDAAQVVWLSITVAIGIGIVVFLVLWLAAPLLTALFGIPDVSSYASLIGVTVIGQGVIAALIAWYIRRASYVEISLNRATEATVLAMSQIGLGLLGWGALGLLLGAVLSSFAAAGRLVWRARRGRDGGFPRVSRAGMASAARRYRRFPLMSAPARLLNSIGLQAPLILITVLFGTTVGGQFALAHRVMALPLTLVSTAIGNVYFAEASRVRRDQPSDLRRLFLRTTRSIAIIATGPVILAAMVSPFVFGIIFGPEWKDAGIFAAILAPMYLLRLMTSPTHSTLDVLERQDLHLVRELIRLILVIGAVVAAWAIGASPVVTVATIMIVGVVTYVLYGYLTWRAIVEHDARHDEANGSEAKPPPEA